MEEKELEFIKEFFDNRYVLRDDCNEKQSRVNQKFANDDKRIEIIANDFSVIKKLIWAVASATIGQVVLSVFELLKGI